MKLIESIKPTEKRQRVPDATVQGLSLVVQPTGKKLFQYRYRFDKKDKSVTLGTVPAMSLKEARDKAVDFRRMLDVNTDPLHSQRQQKAIEIDRTINSTIGAAMQRYEAEKLDKLRSGDNAKSFLREFKAEFAHLELANFSKDMFRKMLRNIVEQGHSVKANRVYTHVRTFMN